MAVTTLGEICVEVTTLTSAQVKALNGTPIEVVPSPGADKMLVFHGAMLVLKYGSNVFVVGGDLQIEYDDGGDLAVTGAIDMTNFIINNKNAVINAIPVADAWDDAADVTDENLAIVNVGGAIAGNAAADNTIDVHVWYSIIDV